MTAVEKFREDLKASAPCPKCGCKLVELTEDGPICARCDAPYVLLQRSTDAD